MRNRLTPLFFAVTLSLSPVMANEPTPVGPDEPYPVKYPSDETPSGWSFAVSAGLVVSPSYLGADSYQLSAVPNLSITYDDRFFASLEGVGYNIINSHGWRLGPIARYDFGRDEDGSNPLAIAGGDTDDLRGLGDVDGTVELGGFLEYSYEELSTRLELRQGVGGHEGLIGEVEVSYDDALTVFGREAYYSVGPELVFADKNYTSAYFDVNAEQSAASGLSQFDAGGGLLSVGIHASMAVPLVDDLSLIGFAGYDRLTGDAADSSLVRARGSANQVVGGVFLSYRF